MLGSRHDRWMSEIGLPTLVSQVPTLLRLEWAGCRATDRGHPMPGLPCDNRVVCSVAAVSGFLSWATI